MLSVTLYSPENLRLFVIDLLSGRFCAALATLMAPEPRHQLASSNAVLPYDRLFSNSSFSRSLTCQSVENPTVWTVSPFLSRQSTKFPFWGFATTISVKLSWYV